MAASEDDRGKRLDRFVVERMDETSRARIQEWIRQGRVLVNGAAARPSARLAGSETVSVDPSPRRELRARAEEIPLDILYEDEDLAAINKPAGMTVHAGGGRSAGTLVNALLHHFSRLSSAGGELRPGIVHRLDRMTSGVMLVAKHDQAHQRLARQFQRRRVGKTYWALVHGVPGTDKGRRVEVDGVWRQRLEMPIGRHPRVRAKMSARAAGREARSDFRILRRREGFALLEVRIHTGRTHQIRVHLSAIGHPVVGDRLYGAPKQLADGAEPGRFFLHAHEIRFAHPASAKEMCVTAPLPEDFTGILDRLEL